MALDVRGSVREPTALTGAELQILLSLVGEQRHGLGIMHEVEARTGGRVSLGAGTLYGALKRMAEAGLIEDRPAPSVPSVSSTSSDVQKTGGSRRRYYGLTGVGRRALAEDVGRMSDLVEQARERGIERADGEAGHAESHEREDPLLSLADDPFDDDRIPVDASTELDRYLYG